MKKSYSGDRKASAKRTSSSTTVEDYLARVPEPARSTLLQIRTTIRSAVPAETIEVISYSMPAFKYKKVLMWYAAFSDHCSLFPTASVLEKFREELQGYRLSKGTIQFPIGKPLPAALVKSMVKARLKEVEGKS